MIWLRDFGPTYRNGSKHVEATHDHVLIFLCLRIGWHDDLVILFELDWLFYVICTKGFYRLVKRVDIGLRRIYDEYNYLRI